MRSVRDARTNRELPLVDGPPRWRPAFNGGGAPYKWEFVIPQFVLDTEIGSKAADIWVYATGNVSWPGREVMKFDDYVEAMRYVEATYALKDD